MPKVTLAEASARLEDLIERARRGDEIIIIKGSLPVAKVVAIQTENPKAGFGSARGLIHMSEDFDDPLEDFRDYMK